MRADRTMEVLHRPDGGEADATIRVPLLGGAIDVNGWRYTGTAGRSEVQFLFTLRGPRGGHRASVHMGPADAGALARVCRIAAHDLGEWDIGGWWSERLTIRSGDRYRRLAYTGRRGRRVELSATGDQLTDLAAAIRFVGRELGVGL